MKKLVLTILAMGLLTSPAFAIPWSWNMDATDVTGNEFDVSGNPAVVTANDAFFEDMTTSGASTINQSFTGGADDNILDNGDTFSEFGFLSVIGSNIGGTDYGLIFDDVSTATSSDALAYIEFSGLTGSIYNYNSLDPVDTTLANYQAEILDDTFSLAFDAGVGSIDIYLDNDTDSTNGALNVASLSLVSGAGTSPIPVQNFLEGQFGLVAQFDSVLDDFWVLNNGTTFEDWIAQYGVGSILTESFNLGATLTELSDNGEDILFDVANEGSFQVSAVPEPSTFILLGGGLLGLGFYARRKKK